MSAVWRFVSGAFPIARAVEILYLNAAPMARWIADYTETEASAAKNIAECFRPRDKYHYPAEPQFCVRPKQIR